MNKDLYDMFEEFINGDFTDKIITLRLREQILALRLAIDSLEHLNRSRAGLTTYQREDLEDHWKDLDSMTMVYIYFSGDSELEDIPEWNYADFPNVAGWDYWTEGDLT